MKKLFLFPALAALLTAMLAAGCARGNDLEISTTRVYDSTRVTEGSTAIGETTTRRKKEPSTSIGEGLSSGLHEASENLSEMLTDASERFSEGVSQANESLSSVGEALRP